MAEAAVGERTSPPTRFYCHTCKLEISIFNNDYLCPLCSGGFIEELPPPAATIGESSNSTGGNSGSSSSIGADQIDIDLQNHFPGIRMDGLIASALRARRLAYERRTPDLEISIGAGGSGSGSGSNHSNSSSDPSTGSSGSRVDTGNRRNGNERQHQPNYQGLDSVFLELITSLSSGEDNLFGNSQMFFMGNPGDYAWGREGIDTVVTQLLNHMDISGPPPLPKEKIAEIPTVAITETEVGQKLKCSVCWEDFQLQEAVRKLPCLHVYHENCIVPWLDLHGTCPICRKSLQIEPRTNCPMQNGADYTSTPTATVSVTVTTPQPGTSAASRLIIDQLRNINANRSLVSQNIPPQPQPPPPPVTQPAAPPSSTNQAPSASGQSGQGIHFLAFDDGNIEYDFD